MTDSKPKTGKEYFDMLEKTAARVDKWPDWKKGNKSRRDMEQTTDKYAERAREILRMLAVNEINRTRLMEDEKVIARALEQSALEARIEEMDWSVTQPGLFWRTEFIEHANSLRARLAELMEGKDVKNL